MKFIVLAAFLAVASATSVYPATVAPPPPPPQPYSFEAAVQDAASGVDNSLKQRSDGQTTNAVYRVALPDGRVQVVTLKVVGDSGSVTDVQYEAPKYYRPVYRAY